VAQQAVEVSEVEEERAPDLEPVGSFQPAIHAGIPVAMHSDYGGRAHYGGMGKNRHPPLACPDPRYPATLRGFYRCPACGVKAPLAGQVSTREMSYELADTVMEAVISGAVQAARIAWQTIAYIAGGVRWLLERLRKSPGESAGKASNGDGMAYELVLRLAVIGTIMTRYGTPEDQLRDHSSMQTGRVNGV